MALANPIFSNSGAATFLDARNDLAGLVAQNVAGLTRAGILWASQDLLVTGTNTLAVDIHDFNANLERHGSLLIANRGTAQATLDAAPSANSRIDVVYVLQRETQAPMSDSADGPIFGVLKGTAAAVPTVPTNLPEGALPLARVQMPAGASTTNSDGVIITQTYPWSCGNDGRLRFRSTTEMNAWDAVDGQRAIRLDDNSEWRRSGGVWVSQSRTLLATFRAQNATSFVLSGVASLIVHPADGWIEPDMCGVYSAVGVESFPFLYPSGGVRPSAPVDLGRLFVLAYTKYEKRCTWNTDGSLTVNGVGNGDNLIPVYRRIPIPEGVAFS